MQEADTPGLRRVNRDYEMAWSGVQTFFKLPVCLTSADLSASKVDVAIGGIPWDGTATGFTGTHLGPSAVRMGDYITDSRSLSHLDVRVDPFEHLVVCDYGDADVLIGDPHRTYDNARQFVSDILEGNATPIIIGGDHGITWPSATAVAGRYGYGNIGIVHFDAHADTAPDMRGLLHGHGTPMRRLIESGAVLGRDFVQIGLRGYLPSPPILAWMEEQRMKSHYMAEIRKDGFAKVLERAIQEALEHADKLYLSIDVDVLDPAFAPGTGTPEPGGLSSQEVMWAVRRIAAEVGIVGMDVVELSPPYDVGPGITAQFARRCILEGLTGIAMRRLGLSAPDYIDPRSAR